MTIIKHVTFGEEIERMVLGSKHTLVPFITILRSHKASSISFCSNGFQETSVVIDSKMFYALRELVNDPEVINHFKNEE